MRTLISRTTSNSSEYGGRNKMLLPKAGGRNGLEGELATATLQEIRVVIEYV
jgi:hypothetical protein